MRQHRRSASVGRLARAGVVITTTAAAVVAFGSVTAQSAAAAASGGTVTVHGTDFPGRAAQLSLVGYDTLLGRTAETVQPYLTFGPGQAPAGERSLGFDLAGGNAVGSLHHVASLAGTSEVSLAVQAPGGTNGVAYVAFQEHTQRGTTRLWVGRAPLSVGAGGWQRHDATALTYTWSELDTRTGGVLSGSPGGPQRISDFLAGHGGDGPGLVALAYGADGRPFHLDAFRVNGTTYDLEGVDTSLDITVGRTQAPRGAKVPFVAHLRTDRGADVPDSTVILERRVEGASTWEAVATAPAGGGPVTVQIAVTETADYRFSSVEQPLAEGTTSGIVRVHVGPQEEPTKAPDTKPSAPQPSSPAADPATEQAPDPSAGPDVTAPTTEPTAKPSSEPPAEPKTAPTREPEPSPTGTPSPEASDSPSPEPLREPATETAKEPAQEPATLREQPAAVDPAAAS